MVNKAHEPHTAWVVISPAEDVPGEWLAHCLDLDIMSQGRSLAHAIDMMLEAIDLVVAEDRAAGLNPFDRRAPEERWHDFDAHMRSAELTTLADLQSDGGPAWVATKLPVLTPEELDNAAGKPAQQALVHYAGTAA